MMDDTTTASPSAGDGTPGGPASILSPAGQPILLNRELTWLRFNCRVLHEAEDRRNPLLERLRYLAIVSSNLDEFFMKRIGGLKQQVGAGLNELSADGLTPQQQIDACTDFVLDLHLLEREVFFNLVRELANHDIDLTTYDRLTESERAAVRNQYRHEIFPLVTPLAIDPAHPFPFISNLSLNLLVALEPLPGRPPTMARVKVPVGPVVPRFIRVGKSYRYVRLEDVMTANLDLLFPGMAVQSATVFRVTRNSNTELNEEVAGDLLAMIETELRHRKFAPIVRLQVDAAMPPLFKGMLAAELGLNEERDVYQDDVMLGLRDLMDLAALDIAELHHPPHHPVDSVWLPADRNIFHCIRDAGSVLLHHPYESFTTSVERFVREAGLDPKVLGIKMTLYRTSADTRVIDHLVNAARNGKQVAVVVELKARFDEAANIQWASRLEEFGIHVNYGVVGLKTHSKVVLVIRRDFDGLRRYAHIATGNYHAGTARGYSDLGLLSSDPQIGGDLTEFFNFLTTGCKPSRRYRKLLVSPVNAKKAILDKIKREVAGHETRGDGLIRLKTNALEDPDITKALYSASQAGVTVQLVVRDTCRLLPGIKGLSDNITVTSIVGRFLEHSRIYYFRNGGEEEFFIGSTDLMTRNLESRVEVMVPIEIPEQREQLRQILDIQLQDMRSGWVMAPDGEYHLPQPGRGDSRIGTHQRMIEVLSKRNRKIGDKLTKQASREAARMGRGPKAGK